MRGIFLSEGESSTKIFKLHLVLDFAEDSGVDFFLELLSSIRGGAFWSGVSEELLGSSFLGFGLLGECLVSNCGFDSGDIDLEAGAHGVDLVDSLKWDSIDLVWAGDGKETGLELLEANNSLSSESTCEEDEDGSCFN